MTISLPAAAPRRWRCTQLREMPTASPPRRSGGIAPRTCKDYYAIYAKLITTFGEHRLVENVAANDFEISVPS